MSLSHEFSLVCDQVRQEVSGKFIIIGLYTGGITVPQIPFSIPSLAFFNVFRADAPGPYRFTGSLTELGTGALVARASGVAPAPLIAPTVIPVYFQNLQIRNLGTFNWSIVIEGEPEPFMTQFDVALQRTGPMGAPTRMPPRP